MKMAVKPQHLPVGQWASQQAGRKDWGVVAMSIRGWHFAVLWSHFSLLLSSTPLDTKRNWLYKVFMHLCHSLMQMEGKRFDWELRPIYWYVLICKNWITCQLADRICRENFRFKYKIVIVQECSLLYNCINFILPSHQVSLLSVILVIISMQWFLNLAAQWSHLEKSCVQSKIIESLCLVIRSRLQHFLKFPRLFPMCFHVWELVSTVAGSLYLLL